MTAWSWGLYEGWLKDGDRYVGGHPLNIPGFYVSVSILSLRVLHNSCGPAAPATAWESIQAETRKWGQVLNNLEMQNKKALIAQKVVLLRPLALCSKVLSAKFIIAARGASIKRSGRPSNKTLKSHDHDHDAS